MFDHISKHLGVPQKYSATRLVLNSLLGVWKCVQLRSFVFDILLQFIHDLHIRLSLIYGHYFFPSTSSVPDHPPSNVTACNTSSTSVNVTWQPIPLDHRNGILLGYHVRYWRHDKANDTISVVTVNSTSLHAEVEGVGKYKEYIIQVAGSTVAGLGNFSEPVFVRTEQDGE